MKKRSNKLPAYTRFRNATLYTSSTTKMAMPVGPRWSGVEKRVLPDAGLGQTRLRNLMLFLVVVAVPLAHGVRRDVCRDGLANRTSNAACGPPVNAGEHAGVMNLGERR